MKNLSPGFLYLRGDGNPRHNPGEMGMLYLVELPLLFIGLYFLAKGERKNLYLIVLWILIAPLATMLIGEPHALRNNFMIPPFLLISSFALTKLSKKMCTFMFILIGIQLVSVLMTIYFYAPNKFGSFWAESAKKNSYLVIENKDKYDKIILSTKIDNIEYAYPVYAKLDPNLVIEQYGKLPKVYDNVVITDDLENILPSANILILEK